MAAGSTRRTANATLQHLGAYRCPEEHVLLGDLVDKRGSQKSSESVHAKRHSMYLFSALASRCCCIQSISFTKPASNKSIVFSAMAQLEGKTPINGAMYERRQMHVATFTRPASPAASNAPTRASATLACIFCCH